MQVKPFHIFEHRDCAVVLNIDDMTAHRVGPDVAVALRGLGGATDLVPAGPLGEELRAMGLLDDSRGEARPVESPGEFSITCITLFVTQTCNLRCVYCYGDGGGFGARGTMDPSTALRALDWLIAQSGAETDLTVSFSGGEPLLNFALVKQTILQGERQARDAGKSLSFGMTTNGTLLDEEALAFLKEHRVSLVVSVDGAKETHDIQRPFVDGRGSFDSLVPRLRRLLDVLPDTSCRATLVGDTDPRQIRDALCGLGFRRVILTPASSSLFSREGGIVGGCAGMLRLMESEADAWLVHLRGRDRAELEKLKHTGVLQEAIVAAINSEKRRYPCGAGLTAVSVSCSGDVYLCHRFVGMGGYRLGSVFEGCLDREAYRQSPVARMSECARCFARHQCAGGCKHANAGATGSAFSPCQDMCRLSRRALEMAAYVVSGMDSADRGFLVRHDLVPPKPCPFDFP